jgi:hypothetical protein
MKLISYVLVILVITGSVFYYGCDDSGLIPKEEIAGQVKVSQNVKLLPLDPVNDGYYNLFVILTDSFGTPRASHLGRFNVLANGDLIDVSGNPMTLVVNPNDTIDLVRALYSIISIDIGVVTQPGPTRIVAGPVTVHADSITARLLINDTLAVGSAMTSALGPNSVLYIVNTPTGSAGDCSKGIWFCDEFGVRSWPIGSNLNPGWGWQYHGYVRNKTTGEVFSIGTFYSGDNFDSDGAGACADTLGTAYSKPGQDWIRTGCGNLTNIVDGNHEVFATLEPEFRSGGAPPFVLKFYYQGNIVPSVGCNRRDNMFTQRQNIPDISLRVTR